MFGATGNTGKHFLKAALDQGYAVKALMRNPAKVPIENDRLTKVKGDLDDVEGISNLINGVDAVVCLANVPRGSKLGGDKEGWMPGVIENIMKAMKEHKVRRLIFQVGAFTLMKGEVAPNCCIVCCIKDCILGYCLGEELILKENQVIAEMFEAETADIDWTLTRPGVLSEEPSKGTVTGDFTESVGSNAEDATFVDLAAWEVTLLDSPDSIHKAPFPVYLKAEGQI